jgi:hypothetical protein
MSIIIGTLGEDILSDGGGIIDDPVTIAYGAYLIQQGVWH